MQVFIAYTRTSDIRELGATLEAWDIEDLEPEAIECRPKKFELHRRLTSENVARGDYILVDLGCVPTSPEAVFRAVALLYTDNIGMVGLAGARVCRHKVIEKWPMKTTETYDQEHIEAYRFAGYQVIECPEPMYRHIAVPSV